VVEEPERQVPSTSGFSIINTSSQIHVLVSSLRPSTDELVVMDGVKVFAADDFDFVVHELSSERLRGTIDFADEKRWDLDVEIDGLSSKPVLRVKKHGLKKHGKLPWSSEYLFGTAYLFVEGGASQLNGEDARASLFLDLHGVVINPPYRNEMMYLGARLVVRKVPTPDRATPNGEVE